jgi:hypothetical protein
MKHRVDRRTVDLSAYPDLVVIYLGMYVREPRGLKTLLHFGTRIKQAVADDPDGLLLHEDLIYGLLPPHVGMRQYWRDFTSLETWARSLPHKTWWQDYTRDTGGTGFWHETYFMRGGMEAIYNATPPGLGLTHFAPVQQARGAMFSARRRLRLAGDAAVEAPLSEDAIYGAETPAGDGEARSEAPTA